MTRVIAHRGASAHEVENSLAAFRAAVELGADGIELDVHTTLDGVLVVYHDEVAGSHLIREVRFEELRKHQLANGEPVPTLTDALTAIGIDLEVFIEVKTLPADRDTDLFSVMDAGPAPNRYHVHSFDHRIVRRLNEQRPALPCGILSTSYPIRPVAQMNDAGAMELWQHRGMVDRDLMDTVHYPGLEVYAWTVDDPAQMHALIDLGIDALCTNKPDVAREIVG